MDEFRTGLAIAGPYCVLLDIKTKSNSSRVKMPEQQVQNMHQHFQLCFHLSCLIFRTINGNVSLVSITLIQTTVGGHMRTGKHFSQTLSFTGN